jgi:hypothetical protein
MTVGIAALAEDGKAIVLMADKQFTGGADAVRTENMPAKAFVLPNDWIALFAGDLTFAESVVLLSQADFRSVQPIPMYALAVAATIRKAYLRTFNETLTADLFLPRLWDRERFIRREYDAGTNDEIEAAIAEYAENNTCEFLLCGFTPEGDGQVIHVDLDSHEDEHAFGVVGSGGNIARSRLTWQRTGPLHSLSRVLYETFEAKAHSEMNAFVGPRVDAWIMFANGVEGTREVTDDTKTLLNAVFRWNDQTPFARALRDDEKKPDAPPTEWETILEHDKLGPILTEIRKARVVGPSASPSATAQPSSQSQSGGQR